MATTISPGTVTVKITETVSLNGSTYDATNILAIPSVNEVSQRILTIAGQQITEVAEFGSVTGRGKYIRANVQYMRLTNLDDTNSVAIATLSSTGYCWQLLSPGRSWMLAQTLSAFEVSPVPTVGTPTLYDINMIYARGSSIDQIDLELFICST